MNHYEAGAGLRRRLFGSKARRELRLAERAAKRGIATPLPLAAGERREGKRVAACYLLVPFVAGARDLRHVLAERLAAGERRALARAFGAFVRRMHDAGLDQDDLQPNNFLLGPRGAEDLYLIDFERLTIRRRIAPRTRALRLAKLARELPAASRSDRARFLLAYHGGDRGALAPGWRLVARESARLARRDARRLLRVVAERGRRYRPFELAGWRGVRAAESDAEPLARSLAPALAAGVPEARGERGELTLLAAGAHFALAFPATSRPAALRALAQAVLLARRRLAPPPVAVLQRAARGLLVFEGALPRRLDASAPLGERRALLPALTLLLEALAGIGELEAPDPGLVAFAPPGAPLALQLLAPQRLRLSGRPSPGGVAARRALAARLLGVDDARGGAVQSRPR